MKCAKLASPKSLESLSRDSSGIGIALISVSRVKSIASKLSPVNKKRSRSVTVNSDSI